MESSHESNLIQVLYNAISVQTETNERILAQLQAINDNIENMSVRLTFHEIRAHGHQLSSNYSVHKLNHSICTKGLTSNEKKHIIMDNIKMLEKQRETATAQCAELNKKPVTDDSNSRLIAMASYMTELTDNIQMNRRLLAETIVDEANIAGVNSGNMGLAQSSKG